MSEHLKGEGAHMAGGAGPQVDCGADPIQSLVQMFVEMVQKGRIAKGQCPARRPVFLKPHGVVKGTFKIREDLPDDLKVGLFAGTEYPAWVRFSSDTLPTISDWKTTLGIGIKLFDTPTPKIFGQPEETTFDFILQNMDVFFVNTAKDMCEFTKAGVVDGDYGPYLKAHPETAKLLDEMAKPAASVLASPYWSGLPFAFGPDRFVKYKLEPALTLDPPADQPADPTYLAADLEARMKAGEQRFTFCVQFRTDPKTMPLDEATVRWPEAESPYIPVAELILPAQDITHRGQPDYGENLAWNIWRVTKEHEPQGSIADARKVVYAASAEQRRNVNGVPDGEPAHPRPLIDPGPCKDTEIVRAVIHPAIGVMRVGDSPSDYFIGPEVPTPLNKPAGFYRDAEGRLKRQAARFRIYGYNAEGAMVRELTAADADIRWTAHLVNRKAAWYRFDKAMDIPQARDLSVPLRNAKVAAPDRHILVIDPGPRSISGISVSGGADHAFDTGEFKGVTVPLGEMRTDEKGRLVLLGGHGVSRSPSGAPPIDMKDPQTFNNADDWYDDMSDGPVDAAVTIDGRAIPVEGAWAICAPPNYAPDAIGWRTMYDLMTDTAVAAGWLPVPETTSFTKDVLPQLYRLSNLQWVNKGMAAMFGAGGPMDFADPATIARLAQPGDTFKELRRQLMNNFRPKGLDYSDPRLWPWIYGDGFGDKPLLDSTAPNTMLETPNIQMLHLTRWVDGDFVNDWDPDAKPPTAIEDVPPADQPATLDQAAMDYCLADAFHPGCEMTWPMRHPTLYEKPYRLRRRGPGESEPFFGSSMSSTQALSLDGPLHAQGPGDVTKWMGLPWQGDTAYCRSGYDPDFDPYLPTYWPARVPNQVLTRTAYDIVMDESKPRGERLAAFMSRASWYRFIDQADGIAARMERMVHHFGQMGIVEPMPGPKDDPDIPATLYVETLGEPQMKEMLQAFAAVESGEADAAQKVLAAAPPETVAKDPRERRLIESGWGDEQHLADARTIRRR